MKTLLNENTVHVTEEYDIPRYEVRVNNDCSYDCEMAVDDVKECCKLYVMARNYSNLTNVELDDDEDEIFAKENLADDLASYQKFLDRKFGEGEYEAFVLGAYIHSGISFSISKEGDHRCQFDSGQLGFIGLKKNAEFGYSAEHPEDVADILTAAYNGEFVCYEIYDNFIDDCVDTITDYDYDSIKKWKEKVTNKYGVKFDD